MFWNKTDYSYSNSNCKRAGNPSMGLRGSAMGKINHLIISNLIKFVRMKLPCFTKTQTSMNIFFAVFKKKPASLREIKHINN